jgi:hypothetical protein
VISAGLLERHRIAERRAFENETAVVSRNSSQKLRDGFVPHEFQTWRLLHAPPQPCTRERFEDTYNWTVKWNMTVSGATYENTVDNRAWQ